tara:strand:+ start:2342 stop:3742 length:1401 start_codon:yes stop_codon:yes gene_type:complete
MNKFITYSMIVILLLGLSLIGAQVAPYETTSLQIKEIEEFEAIYISDAMLNKPIKINLENSSEFSVNKTNLYIETFISLESKKNTSLKIEYSELPIGTKFFVLSLNGEKIIGPFYANSKEKHVSIAPVSESNFILQCIIPKPWISPSYKFSLIEILDLNAHKLSSSKKYYKKSINRENPVIVVTGFWPPTNEMLRHFSQNPHLNPNGWQGEDWQGLGYDIISFFPEFDPADCDNCGQGYGDFEVDYQDTSVDFWELVEGIKPSTIITFSRGYIDYSWELEYNYYNRTNWYADYSNPFYPTPNPPDSEQPTNFLRNSTLPMQDIVDEINSSNLGLDSYIDINGHPGQFVSEFMGYHGVWYNSLYQFDPNDPCYLAGHVHVGGLIDWDTAKQAAEITITKVIEALDEYTYIPGDVNYDNNIDVLDLVSVVSHILGEQTLGGGSFYAADMNSDSIINIQDIILIINLIL